MPQTADTGDFMLSPGRQWIAFKEFNQLYVMPYREGDAVRSQSRLSATRLHASSRRPEPTSRLERRFFDDSLWTLGHDLYVNVAGR